MRRKVLQQGTGCMSSHPTTQLPSGRDGGGRRGICTAAIVNKSSEATVGRHGRQEGRKGPGAIVPPPHLIIKCTVAAPVPVPVPSRASVIKCPPSKERLVVAAALGPPIPLCPVHQTLAICKCTASHLSVSLGSACKHG